MKTLPNVRALLALLLAVAALAASAAPNYKPVATALVTEHLQAAIDPTSDEEWKKFVEAKKIVGTGLTKACIDALKVGREIIKDGTPADSDYFAEILASSIGVAKVAADRGPAVAATPAPAPKPAEDESKTVAADKVFELQRLRIAEKEFTEKLQQADAVLALPGGDAAARKKQESERLGIYQRIFAITKRILVLKAERALAVADDELKAAEKAKTELAADASADDKKKADDKITTAKAKLAAAKTEDANAKGTMALAAVGLDEFGGSANAFTITAPLREYGFSFSAGGGTVLDGKKSGAVTVFLARYNLRQDNTTRNWNLRQRAKNTAKQIDYSGTFKTGDADQSSPFSKAVTFGNPRSLTFNGPIFGRALSSEKVSMGGKEVRPWLIGWGLGFGFGPEASSAVYLDLAATASPDSGLAHAKPYVGVSFDGIIAMKLFQSFGSPLGLSESK